MRTSFALDRLQLARAGVLQAIEHWNPVDIDRVEASQELLEQSLAALRDVAEVVRAEAITVDPGLREIVADLKQDIIRCTRLVDASAAFQRGLAARLGQSNTGYDSAGKIAEVTPNTERQVLC